MSRRNKKARTLNSQRNRKARKSHAVFLALAFIATIVTCLILHNPADAHSLNTNSKGNSSPILPITGIPAIRTLKGVATRSITNDDIIQYMTSMGIPRTLAGSKSGAVIRADILTSKDISIILHGENTGLPDNQKLWFVEMNGTFIFPAPSKGKNLVAHIGYCVFDPDSGNLYMYGSLG